MDAARIIAGIFGPIYVFVGIGILLNPTHYRRMAEEFLSKPAMIYLGGILALVGGLLILTFHHAWSADWRVVVTILGWLASIKGALLLLAPHAALDHWVPFLAQRSFLLFGGLATLALGLFLSAAAYAYF